MKSGIEHIVATIPVPRSEFESEEFHNLTHGNAFPASPVERQLFYRDDEHLWYQYDGTAWRAKATENYVDTKIAADIATHAALTTGVHGLGALHAAGFHTAGQAVSKVIWKDASTRPLEDAGRTVTLDWTDLDLTAHTSANAKLALLRLAIYTEPYTSGEVHLAVRKNGTTPMAYPYVSGSREDVTAYWRRQFVIVGLDAGQVIEYTIVITETATVYSYIDVLGYIE